MEREMWFEAPLTPCIPSTNEFYTYGGRFDGIDLEPLVLSQIPLTCATRWTTGAILTAFVMFWIAVCRGKPWLSTTLPNLLILSSLMKNPSAWSV